MMKKAYYGIHAVFLIHSGMSKKVVKIAKNIAIIV
jgi:hypothetical protein